MSHAFTQLLKWRKKKRAEEELPIKIEIDQNKFNSYLAGIYDEEETGREDDGA